MPKAPPAPKARPSTAKVTKKPATTKPAAPAPATTMSKAAPVLTDHQTRVYALLRQIPRGRISTYAALARAAGSSPRAIGGAMRNNPFAPQTPCHRCIASTGYLGGFKGDWRTVPSGLNQEEKVKLLKEEGVEFDEKGMLKDKRKLWDEFVV